MDHAVRAYIDAIPSEHRPLFDRLHRLVLEAHPEAAVVLSYQMPTYKVGRNRLFLGVWKHGVSVYGWQQGRDAGFTDRHPELRTSKGTIRLRPETAAAIPTTSSATCCGPPWTTAAASHLPCGKLERSSRAWRNGRRAGFRSRWGNPWGFESPRSHTRLARRFALHLPLACLGSDGRLSTPCQRAAPALGRRRPGSASPPCRRLRRPGQEERPHPAQPFGAPLLVHAQARLRRTPSASTPVRRSTRRSCGAT